MERYRLGLVVEPEPGDESYRGRLVIPYLTRDGVRSIKYRCIEPHSCKEHAHPKYMQPHGQEQRLYNALAYFGDHDTLGVCEGEIDALTATEHLGIPTIGVPGAQQWKANGWHWQLVLKDFGMVVVFADGDQAGSHFASSVLNDAGATGRLVRCPEGEDVNSMVCAGRADELRRKAGLNAND